MQNYHSSHWRSLNIHVIYLRKISKIVVRNASLHITTIKWQWIQPNQTLHLMQMASALQTLHRNFLLLFFLFYHLQTYYFLRWIGLQPNQQITFNLPFQWCHFSHHHHLNLLMVTLKKWRTSSSTTIQIFIRKRRKRQGLHQEAHYNWCQTKKWCSSLDRHFPNWKTFCSQPTSIHHSE